MDADTKTLISLVREMRARQTRFDVCGDDRDLYAKRYAERQVDEWIASLDTKRHISICDRVSVDDVRSVVEQRKSCVDEGTTRTH